MPVEHQGSRDSGYPELVTRLQTTGDVLLQVRNHHLPGAGTPPRIDDADPDRYVGYFENRFGEQAMFVFDRGTRAATLYLGDAGWKRAMR